MISIQKTDKFSDDSVTVSQCIRCVHWDALPGNRCAAYPSGVPREILWNKVDHTNPYPGDRGIRLKERD